MVRQPGRRRNTTKLLALLLVGLVMVGLWFGRGRYGWITMFRLQRQERRLHREMLANLARCEILEREVRRLRQDREYLELQARENLGMVKPGETSYRFVPADSLKKRP